MISYFSEPLPSSNEWTSCCWRKRFNVLKMLDLSTVSRLVSRSDREREWFAWSIAPSTSIRLAVGFIPWLSRSSIHFSFMVPSVFCRFMKCHRPVDRQDCKYSTLFRLFSGKSVSMAEHKTDVYPWSGHEIIFGIGHIQQPVSLEYHIDLPVHGDFHPGERGNRHKAVFPV